MQVNSSSGLGQAVPLVSQDGNHPPSTWAHATAQIVFDISHVAAERQWIAQEVQRAIALLLTRRYSIIINRERDNLRTYPDHCDTPYQIEGHIWYAIEEVKEACYGTPFETVVLSEPWQDAAASTIGNHLVTAIHVERLLYADRHPDNQAASAYKERFQSK